MQKVRPLPGKWLNVVFFLTALLVVTADQLSKTWIRSFSCGRLIFEAGPFRIIHASNTGAIFGLFQGHSFAFVIVSSMGIAALLVYVYYVCRRFSFLDGALNRVALGLVLGGAVGNLIDRLWFGGVTDFISVGLFPAFNVADSAITVGFIIFAYSLFRLTGTKRAWDG
jgi:signal peptidase II